MQITRRKLLISEANGRRPYPVILVLVGRDILNCQQAGT